MHLLAATMRVAHTFQFVRQAKLAAVILQVDINPVPRCLVDCCVDPKPCPYLHLGQVGLEEPP